MKQFLLGYRHPAIKLYSPKVNRKKQGFLALATIPFLLTPFTNWAYLVGVSTLFKLNPLWLYR